MSRFDKWTGKFCLVLIPVSTLIVMWISILFPYQYLWKIDKDNTLTAYWVLVTILYFLIHVFLLLWYLRKSNTSIEKVSQSFSVEAIQGNSLLGSGWQRYQQSFLAEDGPRQKTDQDAENFFNEQTLLAQQLNLRYWQAVPTILVGFGILGTFVGLSFGINGFDPRTTETIKKSIEQLLGGMGTAFLSSVWGMLLSIIFGFYEKVSFNMVSGSITTLCGVLDQRFRLTKADEVRFRQEDFREVFDRMFVYQDDQGREILPAFVFRDLKKEAEQQSKALSSFSTDLAEGINLSTQTINNFGDKIREAMETSIKGEMTPAILKVNESLDRLEQVVNQLQQTKEESSGSFIHQAVLHLEDSLKAMSEGMRDAISGSTITQMEHLVNLMGGASNSLASFPAMLQESLEKLKEGVVIQQNSIREITSKTSEEAATAAVLFKEQAREAAQQVGGTIGSLSQNLAQMLDRQTQQVKTFEAVVDHVAKVLDNGSAVADRMGGAARELNQLSGLITKTTTSLTDSSQRLAVSINTFKEQNQNFLSANQGTIEQLRDCLQQTRQLAAGFQTIENGLKGIFTEIQKGLNQYSQTTQESLNKYLGSFSEQFRDAASGLAGGIDNLRDFVDDIAELLERIPGNGNGQGKR